MRRLLLSSACAGLVLLATACSDAAPVPPSAAPTASASALPSPTLDASASASPSPSPGNATGTTPQPTRPSPECAAASEPRSPEEAAGCLYAAFLDDDRERAADYASSEAIESMFALGGFPTDDQWEFQGCGRPRETQPSSGVSCRYYIPGEVHGTSVEMAMAQDRTVESITAVG